MPQGFVVALLGAESTGKTTLAFELGEALVVQGRDVVVVTEYLREFCDMHRRSPTKGEQSHIADEQTLRIDAAAAGHELVIADTTALMTAVYSDLMFGDTTIYLHALARHRRAGLTLLTAPDLPWQPDGFQRASPQARDRVDQRMRAVLRLACLTFTPVSGFGQSRLQAAVVALRALAQPPR